MGDALVAFATSVGPLAGLAVGYIAGRRVGPRPVQAGPPPRPVCGCEHELAMHDPETNRCHDASELARRWDPVTGMDLGVHPVPCTCRQYVGPRPIDQVFAQPFVMPPADQA